MPSSSKKRLKNGNLCRKAKGKERWYEMMRKVFLSTCPMQKVEAFAYASEDYKNSPATAFPITILLENNCQKGDKAVMLTIVSESEGGNAAGANYEEFRRQALAIAERQGIQIEFVKIKMSSRIDGGSHRRLYVVLVSKFQDGDEIHADITYGFKFMPLVIFAAMNLVYQLKQNVDVAEILYGNLYNGSREKTPELFDITSLFYLNSLSGIVRFD